MGKVVTSEGLNEFVTSGKVEEIKNVAKETPQTAQPPASSTPNAGEPATEAAKTAAVEAVQEGTKKGASVEEMVQELGLDKEFSPEELKTIGERVTRSMAQRHRRMKEAQEAAAEAERFAEQQFNEKRQIEREREELRQKLEAAEKSRQEASPAKKEPVIEDFKDDKGNVDWVKFVDARSEWKADQAVAKDRAEREKAQQEAAQKAAEAAARERFQAAKAKYDDFEEVMGQAGEILIQQSVLSYLQESETGPDLTYYLIKHPDEVAKIVKLSPVAAVAAVARLEGKLGESKDSGKSVQDEPSNGDRKVESRGGAPAPITPLGSGPGIVPKDPSQMSYRELRAYERQRQAKRA